MKILGACVLFSLAFLAWEIGGFMTDINTAYNFDKPETEKDPASMMTESLMILGAISCRPGYYNMSADFTDAVSHCANVEFTRTSRRHFTDQRAQLDGNTPLLCLRTCVLYQAGLVNDDGHGLNETAVHNIFKSEMTKPGGRSSAFKLTKEVMECDRKNPTKWPRAFQNCSVVRNLFRCTRQVMFDCRDKTNEYTTEWMEYISKNKHEMSSEDETTEKWIPKDRSIYH